MKGLKVVLIVAALGFCSSSFASGGMIDCPARHQGGLFAETTAKRTIKPKKFNDHRSTAKLDGESTKKTKTQRTLASLKN